MPARSNPPGLTYAQLRDRRARIAQAIRRGMSAADAATLFKVSKGTVYEACNANGVRFGAGGVGKAAATARVVQAIRATQCREPKALANSAEFPRWDITPRNTHSR